MTDRALESGTRRGTEGGVIRGLETGAEPPVLPYTVVQKNSGATAPTASLAVSLPGPTSGGTVLIGLSTGDAPQALSGFTTDRSTGDDFSHFLYRKAASTGETSWSIPMFFGTVCHTWWVMEIDGLTGELDQANSNNTTSFAATAWNTGNITTTVAECLLVAMFGASGAPVAWDNYTNSFVEEIERLGPPSGAGNDISCAVALKNVSATGIQTCTATPSDATRRSGIIAAYPLLVLRDNFNRADGGLGAPWTVRSGQLAIESNRVIIPTDNLDSMSQFVSLSFLQGFVEADVRQDNGYLGITAAITTPFRRDVSIVFYPDGTVHLEEQPGGNNLGPAWSGYIAGTTVTARLEWEINPGVSADYRVYIDGVLRVSGTTTAHTASTYGVGCGGYRLSGLTTIDNFRCGPLPYTPP